MTNGLTAIGRRWAATGNNEAIGFFRRFMNAVFGLSEETIAMIVAKLKVTPPDETIRLLKIIYVNLEQSVADAGGDATRTDSAVDSAAADAAAAVLPNTASAADRSDVSEAVRGIYAQAVKIAGDPEFKDKMLDAFERLKSSAEGTAGFDKSDFYPATDDAPPVVISEKLETLTEVMNQIAFIMANGGIERQTDGRKLTLGRTCCPDVLSFNSKTNTFYSPDSRYAKIVDFCNSIKERHDAMVEGVAVEATAEASEVYTRVSAGTISKSVAIKELKEMLLRYAAMEKSFFYPGIAVKTSATHCVSEVAVNVYAQESHLAVELSSVFEHKQSLFEKIIKIEQLSNNPPSIDVKMPSQENLQALGYTNEDAIKHHLQICKIVHKLIEVGATGIMIDNKSVLTFNEERRKFTSGISPELEKLANQLLQQFNVGYEPIVNAFKKRFDVLCKEWNSAIPKNTPAKERATQMLKNVNEFRSKIDRVSWNLSWDDDDSYGGNAIESIILAEIEKHNKVLNK
ncbi:MAG: hypothetical protein LBI34_04095 [Puniceicoccales bacterium]|nr:hypothetical protein [Puniceicoccales bacterium]